MAETVACANCGKQIYQVNRKWYHLANAGMSCQKTAQASPVSIEAVAARCILAQRVIEVVEAATIDEGFSGHWRLGFSRAKSDIDDALRDLFRREGIDLKPD